MNYDDSQFQQLLSRTKKASFASNKRDEVLMATKGGMRFTSDQGQKLVKEVHGDKEQQETASALYPLTVDPANFGAVLDAFTFRNSKKSVIQGILRMGPPPVGPVPLDPNMYSALVKRMESNCPFAEDKLLELKLALNGRALFTSEQAQKVVKIIHGDKEQIEGAVALYPAIMDPANFGNVLTGLTFSSSKKTILDRVKGMPTLQQSQQQQPPPGAYGYGGPPPGQHGYGAAPPSSYGAPPPGAYGAYGAPPPGYGYGAPSPYGAPAPQGPSPMDHHSFSQLEGRLRSGFASDKLNEVRMALRGGAFFTSAQAKVLIKAIHSDNEQKQAALELFPQITDRQNFGEALTSMTFSSSKDAVLKQLNGN